MLHGGALLPFGGIKGGSLAFMVKVLAAALGGDRFGFQDESASIKGALTSNAGQFPLLIDPRRIGGVEFLDRIELLLASLADSAAERDGIEITPALHAYLTSEAVT